MLLILLLGYLLLVSHLKVFSFDNGMSDVSKHQLIKNCFQSIWRLSTDKLWIKQMDRLFVAVAYVEKTTQQLIIVLSLGHFIYTSHTLKQDCEHKVLDFYC